MYTRTSIFMIFLVLAGTALLYPWTATQARLAEEIQGRTNVLFRLSGYAQDAVEGGVPIALRAGVLVNTALLLVGIVFLFITVYSGIQWMTAGGNDERIQQALARLKRAILGLLIVTGAWVLTNFALRAAFGPLRPPGTGAVEVQWLR